MLYGHSEGDRTEPEKVKAVLDMYLPPFITNIQRLTDRLVSLDHFLSKLVDHVLPFFKVIKRREGLKWTDECHASFEELKRYILLPPMLSNP